MRYPDDYREFLKASRWKEWWEHLDESDMKRGVPRAPVRKACPEDAELVDLVPPDRFSIGDTSFREIVGRRQSRREYTDEPLTLEELSYLLWTTQGVTKTFDTKSGIVTRRTVPSGGSQHTFETYLCINRVDGIRPGLYRYLPLEHRLVFIREEADLAADVAQACNEQEFIGTAAVIFLWTTIPYRMEWCYNIVAHKVIALDAGHLCQNLYLACESIGLGTCAVGAYYQDEVDAILGVDGKDEFTIYVAPVGRIQDA